MTNLTTITITREVDVSDQECWDVLTTALEGGIGYWSVADCIVRAEDLTITRCNLAESEEFNDSPSSTTWHTMLATDVRRGIEAIGRLIGEGEIHRLSEIGKGFEMCLGDEDGFSAADATLADAIVQAALFNEIRYA
jgi:hypothetical protein